ncbi:prolyl oligopeptidase family serine peptidase [Pseudoalteromonas sp. T1lg23B]|uniref:prolyl oligopeptidase family serine peptidase n=1 Tax=Pseudoalteromonas sp. T1lg23B TaxID=2077097 RepID=UPI000CF6263D|nr:prolyl oligopeptidase family serine peptidase [Pseudoalteromonas sp. T1lg23B]
MKQLYAATLMLCAFWMSALSAQPINAEHLYTNPNMSMVQLSPTGEYVLVFEQQDDSNTLNLLSTQNLQFTSSVSIGKDNSILGYQWLTDEHILFRMSHASESINLLGTIENGILKGRILSLLGYLVHALPSDPNKVMFAKRSKSNTKHKVYIVDIKDLLVGDFDDAYLIEDTGKEFEYYYYDDASQRLIATQYDKEEKTFTAKYIEVMGDEWHTAFTLKDARYSFEAYGFIDDTTLMVLTNKDTDKVVLREFDIPSQTLGKIIYQHPKYDIFSADIRNKEVISASYREYGLTQKVFFSPHQADFQKRLKATFNGLDSHIIGQSEDQKISLLYVNGSNEPGMYFIYDAQQDKAHKILTSYHELSKYTFRSSKAMTITAKDGTQLEAFLTLPTDIDHSTLLVMPHGGPIGIQETDTFNKGVQYLTSRGFAVLRVNFRGSAGFGKAFSEQGVGEFGKRIEEDISAAVSAVTKQHTFKHMCSIGASYGGYSSVMLAIKNPELYDCVIASFGIYDLQLLFNASNYRSDEEYRKFIARTVGEFDNSMFDVSPVYLSNQLKAPILLIAGVKDDVADFEHTNRLKYLLQKNNHPVETMFYPNSAHGHYSWRWERHEMAVTYDYLMRTLGIKEPDMARLDSLSKESLARDYAEIGDDYSFGNNQEKNAAKAYEYYLKAASYGHPRATFNIGARYYRGELVEEDYNKAIEYYKKAAELGYGQAHMRLARMYMHGEVLPVDWQQAYSHLEQAMKLDSPHVKIRMAEFYCSAPAELKDIDKCIELMDIKPYEQISRRATQNALNWINSVLAWVFINAELTDAQLEKVQNFALETFKLDHLLASVEDMQAGQFTLQKAQLYSEQDQYQLASSDGVLRANDLENDRYGVMFDADISGIDRNKHRVALVAHWKEIDEHDNSYDVDTHLMFGSPKAQWFSLNSFEDVKKPKTLIFELYDLNQQLLFKHEYRVAPSTEQ